MPGVAYVCPVCGRLAGAGAGDKREPHENGCVLDPESEAYKAHMAEQTERWQMALDIAKELGLYL